MKDLQRKSGDEPATARAFTTERPPGAPSSLLADEVAQTPLLTAQRHAIQRAFGDSCASPRAATSDVSTSETIQREPDDKAQPNRTGLPDGLKSGVEQLSGHSLDDVHVHYNSPQPAQLQALAYTEGSSIHVAPGQEHHLAHEAWHVVQQMQGRVTPTVQVMGVPVNDDPALEREADAMGARAMSQASHSAAADAASASAPSPAVQRQSVIQRLAGLEIELRIPFYDNAHGVPINNASFISPNRGTLSAGERRDVVDFLYGGLAYGHSYGAVGGEYDISADHTEWRKKHLALRQHINGRHIANPGALPSMSNLEYRTLALEERDPASQGRMQMIAGHVKAHAQNSAGKATGGAKASLNAPVAACFTGIPVVALQKLLHGDVAGLGLFDTMNNALDPSLYYQTTVGALPTEVPSLFTQAAVDIEANNPGNANLRMRAKSTLLRQAVLAAQQTLAHGDSNALRLLLTVGERSALQGWLTLIAQTYLAYQLETTSLRYRDDGHGHRFATGGTTKNLLPYLNKTLYSNTIAALPPGARPDIAGANGPAWLSMLARFNQICSGGINLVATLGLNDYDGQNYHKEGTLAVVGVIGHTEILAGRTPSVWLSGLLQGQPHGDAHVRSGHQLGLDAGQEHLTPGLQTPGQQAIPLEDRATQSKLSFGDEHDIAGADATILSAWNTAKTRRLASTTGAADYALLRAAVNGKLAAFGNLPTLVPSLVARQLRFNALPPVAPADGTLLEAYLDVQRLDTEIDTWHAAVTNVAIALSLMRPLVQKANWSTKGKGVFGTKVPNGISQMRDELRRNNAAGTTLNNLRTIALGRLASGDRDQATTDMYELARDTPGWMAAHGAANWNLFVAKYNLTNNAV